MDTNAEYYEQRRKQKALEAHFVVAEILLAAEGRILGSHGPFTIVHKMLNDYFRLWGWKYYGGISR